jgi:hypothetical protein
VVSFTPRPLYPREIAHGTYKIEGWIGLRTILYDVERRKILPIQRLKLRSLGSRACSHHCTDCAISTLFRSLYALDFIVIVYYELEIV